MISPCQRTTVPAHFSRTWLAKRPRLSSSLRKIIVCFLGGVTLDELKNWVSIGVVHPDDLEAVIAQTSHSVETGEPFDFEHCCRRFDGVFRRLQARGIPFRNPQGQIERWYALLTDMEDQRRAEEALRTNERSLNLIINTIPELAWSANSDGFVDFLNQRE